MTTPQDASPLQGAGKPESAFSHWSEAKVRTELERAYGDLNGAQIASEVQGEELATLRAQRQAWEEEEAKLGARIEHLKAVVREYAPESTAASAETLPVTAIEVRIEEDRQSLASLRKENARLQRDCSGLDDVATGLRARVEELEGVTRDVVVRDVPTGGGDFESILEPRKGVDIGAWSERRDEALSSLGEQGGEVAS